MNKVFLHGRLGQDPELRYTQNGTAVCNLSVATSKSWVGNDGKRQEQTEWHRVVVWGKPAENCATYLKKGREAIVEGELQTRSYEKDGVKQYTTEIVANQVHFVGGGGQQGGQQPQQDAPRSGGSQRGGGGGGGGGQRNQRGGGSQPGFNNNQITEPFHPSDLEDIPF